MCRYSPQWVYSWEKKTRCKKSGIAICIKFLASISERILCMLSLLMKSRHFVRMWESCVKSWPAHVYTAWPCPLTSWAVFPACIACKLSEPTASHSGCIFPKRCNVWDRSTSRLHQTDSKSLCPSVYLYSQHSEGWKAHTSRQCLFFPSHQTVSERRHFFKKFLVKERVKLNIMRNVLSSNCFKWDLQPCNIWDMPKFDFVT